MDFGDTTGLLALILSAIALWQGWRTDSTTRKLLEDIQETRDREAERVDKLIEHLINLSGDST